MVISISILKIYLFHFNQNVTWQKVLHMKINGMKFQDWILKLVVNYRYLFTKELNQSNMLEINPTK
jgi:hypothetical protein